MSADQRGEWAELLDESWVGPMDEPKVDQWAVSRVEQSDGLWGMRWVSSRAEEWVVWSADWMAGQKVVL